MKISINSSLYCKSKLFLDDKFIKFATILLKKIKRIIMISYKNKIMLTFNKFYKNALDQIAKLAQLIVVLSAIPSYYLYEDKSCQV